jgi:hypothetical protein
MRAKCPAHLTLLDLICLTISGDEKNYEVPHDLIYKGNIKVNIREIRYEDEVSISMGVSFT